MKTEGKPGRTQDENQGEGTFTEFQVDNVEERGPCKIGNVPLALNKRVLGFSTEI